MKNAKYRERVEKIYDMLFEMARGNFSIQIVPSKNQDEIDEIYLSLNTIAEKIYSLLSQSGSGAPLFIIRAVLQPLIVIENDSIIHSFRPHFPAQLGYTESEFYELNFSQIVTFDSKTLYEELKAKITEDYNFVRRIKLVFLGASNQHIHFYCTMEKHLPGNIVVISSISNLFEEAQSSLLIEKEESDKIKIHALYDYIMSNLNKQLPTTPEFSELFKLNQFKIKDEFRKTFNTSIYKLYTDERLKMAYKLIEETDFPLKSIAFQCGFQNYLTFSKAFIKKFSCNPSAIKRKKPLK